MSVDTERVYNPMMAQSSKRPVQQNTASLQQFLKLCNSKIERLCLATYIGRHNENCHFCQIGPADATATVSTQLYLSLQNGENFFLQIIFYFYKFNLSYKTQVDDIGLHSSVKSTISDFLPSGRSCIL